MIHASKCPNCRTLCEGVAGGGGCDPCAMFVCADCDRWVTWEDGGADASPGCCSHCWNRRFRLRYAYGWRWVARWRSRLQQARARLSTHDDTKAAENTLG